MTTEEFNQPSIIVAKTKKSTNEGQNFQTEAFTQLWLRITGFTDYNQANKVAPLSAAKNRAAT